MLKQTSHTVKATKAGRGPWRRVITFFFVICALGCLYIAAVATIPKRTYTFDPVAYLFNYDQRLSQMLSEAAIQPNKTVVVTTVTGPWDDLLDLWLKRMLIGQGTAKYLNHILVLCMDEDGYNVCKKKPNLHCYQDMQADKWTPEMYGGSSLKYGSKSMVRMMWRRLELLTRIINLGYNFLLSDMDVIWFKDPFPWLNDGADMVFSCDWWFEDKKEVKANGGFFFTRSNERTKAFFQYWQKDHEKRYPENQAHSHEQAAFRDLRPERDEYTAKVIGLTVDYLPTQFFGSLCQLKPQFRVKDFITFHPVCVRGKDLKQKKLNEILKRYDTHEQASADVSLTRFFEVMMAASAKKGSKVVRRVNKVNGHQQKRP